MKRSGKTTGFNIPHAPVVTFTHATEREFQRLKEKMSSKLPILETDDILRHHVPYIPVIQALVREGYQPVVDEILYLKEAEESEVRLCHRSKTTVLQDLKLLLKLSETLKFCYGQELKDQVMFAAVARFELGQELLGRPDLLLANHFVLTALNTARLHRSEDSFEFQAKMRCFLAYIGRRRYAKLSEQVRSTIEHLEIARNVSKNKSWLFRSKSIVLALRRPIAIYGLREAVETVTCESVPVYKIATLLYYELLMNMAAHSLEVRRRPTFPDYDIALKLTLEALALAKEIRYPAAVLSALTNHGILLRRCKLYTKSISIFQELIQEAVLHSDSEAESIAVINIGQCLHGQSNPQESMEWLSSQHTVAQKKRLKDLEADSLQKISFILMEEGHNAESEECIVEAHDKFSERLAETQAEEELSKDITKCRTFKDAAWAFSAIAAGHHQWGRLAGLCRQAENLSTLQPVLDWKGQRKPMEPVPSPSCHPKRTSELVGTFQGGENNNNNKNKIPTAELCTDVGHLGRTFARTLKFFTQQSKETDNSKFSSDSERTGTSDRTGVSDRATGMSDSGSEVLFNFSPSYRYQSDREKKSVMMADSIVSRSSFGTLSTISEDDDMDHLLSRKTRIGSRLSTRSLDNTGAAMRRSLAPSMAAIRLLSFARKSSVHKTDIKIMETRAQILQRLSVAPPNMTFG